MTAGNTRSNPAAILCLFLLTWAGCASSSYQFGMPNRPLTPAASEEANQLTFGGEQPRLDRAERWIHYPSEKLRQWLPGKEPTLDPEERRSLALGKAQEYLELNELNDVHIDVRQYDPATQWQRLRENDRIHPIWKYTDGTLSHLSYTLMPGRVFRTDSFNPYTNTLSLNSTDPAMALYTAAEAKIIFNRRYPGLYLAACRFPIVGISNSVQVANDVLSYARIRQDWDSERELTPQIYSNFGADMVFHLFPFLPGSNEFPLFYAPLMSLAGSAAGEAAGQAVLDQRSQDKEQE